MNTNSHALSKSPILPRPLALPLRVVPSIAHSSALVTVLNKVFASALRDGELDFLEGQVMLVRVSDANLEFRLTLSGNKLRVANKRRPHDLSIEGTVFDFMLLATRREDADTLFFNRRLKLGGSTELGLYVKNFLDALEIEERWEPLLKVLNRTTSVVERFA
ncbi:SCP2 domain-containing protein [Pseudomonadota bacterium]